MTYLISNLSFPLSEQEPDFRGALLKELHCAPEELLDFSVYKRSVDARKKDKILLSYTLSAEVAPGTMLPKSPFIRELQEELPTFCRGDKKPENRPVIVGFGPAGIFCALILARAGYRPIILEQGAPMEERVRDVEAFWQEQKLNPLSNIQFGEGGAGTFSDGKLMTRINDPYCRYILEEFVKKGAPEEVLQLAKPHIGTDLLRQMVVALRDEIISLGGELHFHTKVTGFQQKQGRICGVTTEEGSVPCDALFLAMGNAARELYAKCLADGIEIASKPFSVGVRIEHLQTKIDEGLFGNFAGHPLLGHGEYQLSQREADTGRAVYTFCMCPGGVVVPAASEQGGIVTNGMSYHARDGRNANSALAVSVDQRDFGTGALDGLAFQRSLEEKAYQLTGSFRAPIQTVGEFMSGLGGAKLASVLPTYAIGTEPANFRQLFPDFIIRKMEEGIRLFGRRLPGFHAADAVMTAPETRTSSPVRILRGEDRQSTSVRGIYPCGEGSGYAGGIMSSAVDGIHAAICYAEEFAPID